MTPRRLRVMQRLKPRLRTNLMLYEAKETIMAAGPKREGSI